MVKGIEIRQITVDELSAVFNLGNSRRPGPFHEEWTENTLAESLVHDMSLSFTAKRKKDMAGFIIGKKSGPSGASIVQFFISPRWKGKGIEKTLLGCFLQRAEELSINEIHADIDPESEEAAILAEAGFSEEKKFARMKRNI